MKYHLLSSILCCLMLNGLLAQPTNLALNQSVNFITSASTSKGTVDNITDGAISTSNTDRYVTNNGGIGAGNYVDISLGGTEVSVAGYRFYHQDFNSLNNYEVSYWDSGSSNWVVIHASPGASATATSFSGVLESTHFFSGNITTDSIRFELLGAGDGKARIVEIEIYDTDFLPAAPTNLTVTPDTSDLNDPKLILSWTDNATDETHYEVTYKGKSNSGVTDSLASNTTSDTIPFDFSITSQITISVYNTEGSSSAATTFSLVHPRNVTFGKTATGGFNSHSTRTPSKAIDGDRNDLESRFQSEDVMNDHYLEVDLGGMYQIDGYQFDMNSSSEPHQWKLEYWNGTGWVEAHSKDTLTAGGPITPDDTLSDRTNSVDIYTYKYDFSSVNTNMVKLTFDSLNRMRLYELEVYGEAIVKTWNGTSWSPSAPQALENVVINGNYNTSTNGNIADVYDVTINSGDTLIISNGGFVQNTGDFTNNGQVDIISGGALNTNGDGTISGDGFMIRRGSRHGASAGKYIVVGAPVASATFSRLGPGSVNYAYDESKPYSSTTDSAGSGNDGLNRFILKAQTDTMIVGRGYFSAFTKAMIFEGSPNDGDISLSLKRTEHDSTGNLDENSFEGFNLIANPYPCAINFTSFINGNIDNITGSIYLWDDFGSRTGRGTNSDYVTVNMVGTAAASRAGNHGNWDGYLRSGQGFFVQLDSSKTNVGFADSMRTTNNNGDGAFFRSIDEIASLKFNLTDNQKDNFSESLVGFVNGATKGVDKLYDASLFSNNGTQLYSLINDKKFAIQGLPSLNGESKFSLGLRSEQAEELTISLSSIKNVSNEYVVLLTDKKNGLTVNLTQESEYKFSAEKGVDNNRFDITVTNGTTSIESVNTTGNGSLYYQISNQSLLLGMKGAKGISTRIEISDMLGRNLLSETYTLNGEISVPFQFASNQIYLIKLIAGSESINTKTLIK